MIRRYLLLLLILFSALSSVPQTAFIDSLEKALPGLTGKARRTALGDLSWELNGIDANRSEKYARELLMLAGQLKDSTEIGDACNLLCVALYRKGKYDEAIRLNHRAYAIRRAAKDKRAIGSSLNKFVNIYSDQVKLDSALFYALQALKIFEEVGDSGAVAQTHNGISSIYQKDRNWKESLGYAEKAYAVAGKIGFTYAKAGAAGNIAICKENLGELDEAILWYEKARADFEKMGSLVDLGNITLNLGVIYRKQRNLQKAYEAYLRALQVAEQTGEGQGQAHASANLGNILNIMGRPTEAIPYLLRAEKLADEQKIQRVRLLVRSSLAEAYARTGKGELAADRFAAYISLHDSLYNEERAQILSEMRTRFEVEKKEQENEFLKKENELKERQNRNILFGSVLLILFIIVAAVFYYVSRKRKREAVFQMELVKERERGLAAVFEATEEERKRIAKDLHDGIGQQLSGLRMSWESLSEKVEREQKEKMELLSKVLDDACRDVRTISHQMMPKALSENGLLSALQDLLRKSLGISGIEYRIEHFQVENERFNERVEIGLYRVCQELISNIIRHSGASEVVVQLYRNKRQLILIVEDNGRGFDSKAKRDGIGLMNITSRISTVGGEVVWEPGPQSGSVATIRVPIIE